MFRFSIVTLYFLLLGTCQSNAESMAVALEAPISLRAKGYTISTQPHASAIDEKWAQYFYDHLKNRVTDRQRVLLGSSQKDYLTLKVKVDTALSTDYCLKNDGQQWLLTARTERGLQWLIYQMIKRISEDDPSVEAPDLNPSIINLGKGCASFAFAYREPHFLPNLNQEYNQIYNTHNVEIDWGLWGHNLSKVIDKDNKALYATVEGKRNESQLDFASDALYQEVEHYIIDNFGAEPPMKFVIMPNDNPIVSDTPKNKSLGSTPTNATPSVSYLVNKLAKRFPKHTFYTSGYRTTRTPPTERLADNTGVIISTIDLPKGIALPSGKATETFYHTLSQWKAKTNDLYLWDYACDFDDYFTPYPILKGFQKQLKVFKEKGVKGVFVNGSGYDYSTFADVQTFVIASLLIDESLSVDALVTRFFRQYYPVSGALMTAYYLSLENAQQQQSKPLQPYGNFAHAQEAYLDPAQFVSFYDKLSTLRFDAQGEERKALEKLYAALSFTRLQLAYRQGYSSYGFAQRIANTLQPRPEVQQWLAALATSEKYKEMARYQEEEKGSVKGYIEQWNSLLAQANFQNLLLGKPLQAECTLDEDYQDLSPLTDGVEGFPLDYHIGWVINSVDDLKVQLPPEAKKAKKIALTFLQDEKSRFYMPTKIEIYKNSKLYKTMLPPPQAGVLARTLTTDIDLSDSDVTQVRIYRNRTNQRNLLATSEIRLIP